MDKVISNKRASVVWEAFGKKCVCSTSKKYFLQKIVCCANRLTLSLLLADSSRWSPRWLWHALCVFPPTAGWIYQLRESWRCRPGRLRFHILLQVVAVGPPNVWTFERTISKFRLCHIGYFSICSISIPFCTIYWPYDLFGSFCCHPAIRFATTRFCQSDRAPAGSSGYHQPYYAEYSSTDAEKIRVIDLCVFVTNEWAGWDHFRTGLPLTQRNKLSHPVIIFQDCSSTLCWLHLIAFAWEMGIFQPVTDLSDEDVPGTTGKPSKPTVPKAHGAECGHIQCVDKSGFRR